MRNCAKILMATAAFCLALPPAVAQQARNIRTPASEFGKPVDYPKADTAAVALHFNRARKIAGEDLYPFFDTLCIQDQLYKQRTNGAQYLGTIPPQKVFDNLYHIGQMMVSAWAIKTPAGIILIDALNNADEAKNIMVPEMVSLGLDPKDVKMVIITHAHGDHYGGAQYFRDTYGAKLLASDIDWGVMEKMTGPGGFAQFDPAPKRGPGDVTVKDGGVYSLGGTDIHFALTPAHTPGTLSLYFKVTDNGKPYTAGMYGGIGMPRTEENKRLQLASMAHWMDVTRAAHVDAQIGNHPLHFNGPARLEILKYREPGQTNPFVVGPRNYQRYMELQHECVKLSLARDGIAVP